MAAAVLNYLMTTVPGLVSGAWKQGQGAPDSQGVAGGS